MTVPVKKWLKWHHETMRHPWSHRPQKRKELGSMPRNFKKLCYLILHIIIIYESFCHLHFDLLCITCSIPQFLFTSCFVYIFSYLHYMSIAKLATHLATVLDSFTGHIGQLSIVSYFDFLLFMSYYDLATT